MSERYQKLFALSENLYAESAPLLIAAGALLKDNQTGKVLAQIKFKNISAKTIKAVKVSVKAYDVSGAELQGVAEHQYLDLSAARDTEFGQKNAIILPDKVTRSFTCECKSVIFSDGTNWEAGGAEWKPLIQPQALQKRLGGLSAQYKRDIVKQAQFVVTDDRDLWICTCGAINRQSEAKCHACHGEKTALLAALDMEALKNHNAEHNRAEAERKEKEAAEATKKRAKTKKISIISAACAVVVIAAIVVITQVVVPSGKYNSAVALMNEGKYQEAIAIFSELDGYGDSRIKIDEAKNEKEYQEAINLLNNGNFEEALKEFEDLSGYKDSADMLSETKYQWAISLLGNDDQDAYEIFISLGDYKDCQEYLDKFELYLVEEDGDSYSGGFASSVRTYEYDDNHLILSTLEYDTSLTTTVYEYSDDNVLIKSTDTYENSNGITSTTVKEYDEYGNVISEAFNNSSGTSSTTTNSYTYYENGKPKTRETVIFQDGQKGTTTFYTYDENGGYSYEMRSATGEITANYQLECDSHGNVISCKELKDGKIIDIEYECSNTYDGNGNLTEQKYSHGYTYKWEYDENNLVTDQYIYSGDEKMYHTTYMYGYFYTN